MQCKMKNPPFSKFYCIKFLNRNSSTQWFLNEAQESRKCSQKILEEYLSGKNIYIYTDDILY